MRIPVPGDQLVCALTAIGLPGTSVEIPDEPLADRHWQALMTGARFERIEPLLALAVTVDAWPATGAQIDEALALNHSAMALVLELERELVGVHADLAGAGIPMRVLKGPAIAHLDEHDQSLRAFGDIDVLVRSGDVRDAIAVLEARGGSRRYGGQRAGFDRHVSKGASFRFERNVEVDLHRTIAPGPFGLAIDLDDLFDHHQKLMIGSARLEALDRPNRFVHACYHASLGRARPRRSAQRDIVLTAPADADELASVLARARRWRGEAVIAHAVASAVEDLRWRPVSDLAEWAAGYRFSGRERRWLDAYRSDGRSSARLAVVGAGAVRGLGARARYVTSLLVPPTGASQAEAVRRWQRGARALRRPR